MPFISCSNEFFKTPHSVNYVLDACNVGYLGLRLYSFKSVIAFVWTLKVNLQWPKFGHKRIIWKNRMDFCHWSSVVILNVRKKCMRKWRVHCHKVTMNLGGIVNSWSDVQFFLFMRLSQVHYIEPWLKMTLLNF